MDQCRVCKTAANVDPDNSTGFFIHRSCPRCGSFAIACDFLEDWQWRELEAARLSHRIRRMQPSKTIVRITADLAKRFVSAPLPSIQEQADTFILWIGEQLLATDPTTRVSIGDARKVQELVATVGGVGNETGGFLAGELCRAELAYWDSPTV